MLTRSSHFDWIAHASHRERTHGPLLGQRARRLLGGTGVAAMALLVCGWISRAQNRGLSMRLPAAMAGSATLLFCFWLAYRWLRRMIRMINAQRIALEAVNAQLASANADLERRVAERTSQLEEANHRLSREIDEKEGFLRAVSHDLNAPLRNISGMAAMLLMKHRETFDADVVHRLERIRKNAEVESELISELLDLSRLKTRRERMERFDLGDLIRGLVEMFEHDLSVQAIALNVDTALPMVIGERARFRQVFQNLIDNAIKYMGSRPIREIHIGCERRGEAVELYVRDTGLGIDPPDVAKVFHIFRRGKGSQIEGVSGKGVGLAIVKSIIETYGGSIWVESHPDQGSTFRFTIDASHLADAGTTREAA